MRLTIMLCFLATCLPALSQVIEHNPGGARGNKFEQLGPLLPTPNEYRTASGAPGARYWQQKVDYDIKCELDEINLVLTGNETITYHNNSPDDLSYLWLQLDENQHSFDRHANYQFSNVLPAEMSVADYQNWLQAKKDKGHGVNITSILDAKGNKLSYTVNRTMMRIDLPSLLKPGKTFVIKIGWNYKITDRMKFFGRGGYEYFPDNGNYLYTMSQWYPRLCAYTDFRGWQNHQYANKEFALSFGDFRVSITTPADHLVGATGECQNYQQVLNPTQYARWKKAQLATEPIQIVTLNEAKKNESSRNQFKKTWIFKADNVRDFAWTASRKFVWDAMPTYIEGRKVMCMSYYGKEAYPLYHQYSTKLIAHTLKVYSHHTIPYPYPVAQSVEASNGIEYPMICFNFGRADENGQYTEQVKNGMMGVVIHEVGHNFFPMIINNDEREWSWMDEGINSFVEFLAEKAWDSSFASRRGPAVTVTDYMKQPANMQEPVMTNVDNILLFGANAYVKPAAAMNILRQTIMGPAKFDHAFRTYARRWAFKHPTPADLFRTMEDASAEDLDWFWRGWFFTTDHCDMQIDTVKYLRPTAENTVPDSAKQGLVGYFYEVSIKNLGGLVMPVILEWTYTDGSTEIERIPAQVWRMNEKHVLKAYMKEKEVASIRLDPFRETADIDESNNHWNSFASPGQLKITR